MTRLLYDRHITYVSCLWGHQQTWFVFCVCKCLGRVRVNACQYPASPWFGDAGQNDCVWGGEATLKVNRQHCYSRPRENGTIMCVIAKMPHLQKWQECMLWYKNRNRSIKADLLKFFLNKQLITWQLIHGKDVSYSDKPTENFFQTTVSISCIEH